MERLKMIKEWFCGIKERFFGAKEEETVAEFVPTYYKEIYGGSIYWIYKTLPVKGYQDWSEDGQYKEWIHSPKELSAFERGDIIEISKKEFEEIKKTFI